MNQWNRVLILVLLAAGVGCGARAHAPDGSAVDGPGAVDVRDARDVSPANDRSIGDADALTDLSTDALEGDTQPAVCGNSVIEYGEQCDPPGSCPTTCPNRGCTKFMLQGSAATCDATCVVAGNETTCANDDGCCPSACTTANDRDCNVKCDNGTKESMETCDPLSSCPMTCPAMGCQLRRLVNGGTCTAECVNDKQQTECTSHDGCCPSTCNATNDSDCSAKCGNGVIEGGEQCDPPGTCPTSCPNRGCTKFALQGSAATCNATCVEAGNQTTCVHDDGCCPTGCNATNDRDCGIKCDNGAKEGMETCDPLSSCPTACPAMGCQLRKLVNGGTCTAACVNDRQQTACLSNDGCCPSSCNATNDSDCAPKCGNSVIESGELCDPAGTCPTSCPNRGCSKFMLQGSAATCNATCVDAGNQTTCVHDDGCCPSGCNSTNDRDCGIKCDNGVKEGMETCDPLSSCPTTCPAMGCQLRKLVNGGTCAAECVTDRQQTVCMSNDGCCPSACNANNDSECPPKCGNSVVEPSETCDPTSVCAGIQSRCTSDAGTIRTFSGDATKCTAVCTETPRTCGVSDGFCPPGCAASADLDCRKSTGQPCGGGTECVTGNCVTGFCCDGSCAGACNACAAANTGRANGTCGPVTAGTHIGNGCPKGDVSSCGNDGECDGAGHCRQYGSDQVCQPATCSNGLATPARRCSGQGSCVMAAQTMCGDYTCGPNACKTSCSSDLDCVIADYCDATKCKPKCQNPSNDNLVPNAGFDRMIWMTDGSPDTASQTFWQSSDGTGCENSGSARVGPNRGILSDCFPVVPNKDYFFGFMYRAVTFDPVFEGCAVGWFDDAGCTNVVQPSTSGSSPTPSSTWQKATASTISVPAAANHSKVVCLNFTTDRFFEVDRFYFNAVTPSF